MLLRDAQNSAKGRSAGSPTFAPKAWRVVLGSRPNQRSKG